MNFVPDTSAYVTNLVRISDESACSDSGAELVTFLYKLAKGVAPSSFGLNVAHLAGIPDEVIAIASNKSNQMKRDLEVRCLDLHIFCKLTFV